MSSKYDHLESVSELYERSHRWPHQNTEAPVDHRGCGYELFARRGHGPKLTRKPFLCGLPPTVVYLLPPDVMSGELLPFIMRCAEHAYSSEDAACSGYVVVSFEGWWRKYKELEAAREVLDTLALREFFRREDEKL